MSLIQCAKQLALAGVGHEVVIAAGKRISFDEWLGERKPSTNNVAVEKLRKQIEDGLAAIKSPKAKLAEIKKSMADWKMRLEAHHNGSSELSNNEVSRYVTALAIARDRYIDIRRQMQGASREAASKPKPTKSGFDANARYRYYYRAYREMSDEHTWVIDVWLAPKDEFSYFTANQFAKTHEKFRKDNKGGLGTGVALGVGSRDVKLASIRAGLAHDYAGLARPLIRLHKASELDKCLPKILKATGDIKAIVSKPSR